MGEVQPNLCYNIASRAAQSNSVHVSVLKIPIVHADSVSKSFCQKFFFFARAAIVSAGKNNIFRDNDGYNRPSQSQNENNFLTFSLGLEFLNEAENEKNNGKGDSALAPSRFREQSLLILLSVFRIGFDVQFHRFFRVLQTSHVLHNSIVHAKA